MIIVANLLMTVLDEEDNIHCIDILSVDFIQTDNRKITYHIGETRYFHIMNKSELDEILAGHGFLSLDRPNLVNLKKIREFDENYGKVYFTEQTNKESVYATVSKAKYKYVVKIINFFKSKKRP
jgi:DNA-binding LytR/AlgR family response regulator